MRPDPVGHRAKGQSRRPLRGTLYGTLRPDRVDRFPILVRETIAGQPAGQGW